MAGIGLKEQVQLKVLFQGNIPMNPFPRKYTRTRDKPPPQLENSVLLHPGNPNLHLGLTLHHHQQEHLLEHLKRIIYFPQ